MMPEKAATSHTHPVTTKQKANDVYFLATGKIGAHQRADAPA
jgi:hypothetical protein